MTNSSDKFRAEAEELVLKILNDLGDRRGVRPAFENIDIDTWEEINASIEPMAQTALQKAFQDGEASVVTTLIVRPLIRDLEALKEMGLLLLLKPQLKRLNQFLSKALIDKEGQ